MRKIRKQKWFAKAAALLISALLMATMLPQAILATEKDQTGAQGAAVAEEQAADGAVNDAESIKDATDAAVDAASEAAPVSESNADETAAAEDVAATGEADEAATVSESSADETAPAEDAATIASAESAESISGAESAESAGSESAAAGVTSIKVEPIELIEGTNVERRSEDMEGKKSYLHYNLYSATAGVKATVTYNGTEYTGNFQQISTQISLATGKYETFTFDSDQSYENQWTVGHTYDATVSFMGKEATAKVKIIPSPVSSIKVEPIELIEGTNGYQNWKPDSDGKLVEYYHYNPTYAGNTKVTVICDGEEYTGNFGAVASEIGKITGTYYNFEITSDQSSNPWTAGNTYDVTVKFMGKTASAKVSIIPDPLESIHIDDLTMSEGAFRTNRYESMDGASYLCYTEIPGDTEVTLKYDGKEHKEKYSALPELMNSLYGQYIYPSFNSGETRDKQWQAGHTYPATVTLGKAECTFNVTIGKSPFVSIVAEDIEVIENTGGYDDMSGRYRYFCSSNITLTTDTGEEITQKIPISSSYGVSYNGEMFYIQVKDDQNTNPWGVGKHTATASIGALQKDFTVTVVETPVEKIVFNPSVISIYEEMLGIPDSSLHYTIHFKDGSSMDATGRTVVYNGQGYGLIISTPEIKAGERKTVPVSLMGKEATVDVECFAMDSIELAESDGLKLRIKRADGTIDEHKVYYMAIEQPLPYWRLVTDKGAFYINYDCTGDYENMSITIVHNGVDTNLKSNQLKNSKWLKTALHTSDFVPLRYMADSALPASAGFNGKVTKDNIDGIAAVIYLSERLQSTSLEGDALVDADLMKSKIKERLAVKGDFNMSLSPNYDPATNTIRLRGVSGKGEMYYPEVISTDKEQGFWLHSLSGAADVKFVFDKDYKIASIGSSDPFVKGDVNGDGIVDSKDLTTLAKHVAKIEEIKDADLLKAADVNSDGAVDSKDLTHLAKYVAQIIKEL